MIRKPVVGSEAEEMCLPNHATEVDDTAEGCRTKNAKTFFN